MKEVDRTARRQDQRQADRQVGGRKDEAKRGRHVTTPASLPGPNVKEGGRQRGLNVNTSMGRAWRGVAGGVGDLMGRPELNRGEVQRGRVAKKVTLKKPCSGTKKII